MSATIDPGPRRPGTLYPPDLDPAHWRREDPDPWLAVYLDDSIPLDDDAKAALVRNLRSGSRARLLPFIRPVARTVIVVNQVYRAIVRDFLSSSRLLHRLIHWGLRRFVKPEANYLILRHFHIGSELLAFIAANVEGFRPHAVPLRPRRIADLIDNTFVQHDLNIYNFVIELGAFLRERDIEMPTPPRVDFSAITDGPFDLEAGPDGALNLVDLQTAIECYTPLYQLLLTDNDFWRASNSLQLDETIGIYVARILGSDYHLAFVNNHHPMLPLSTLQAGWRLVLHGLAAEQLHYYLRLCKRRQAAAG